jgi:predicted heme/steroid binding protein
VLKPLSFAFPFASLEKIDGGDDDPYSHQGQKHLRRASGGWRKGDGHGKHSKGRGLSERVKECDNSVSLFWKN